MVTNPQDYISTADAGASMVSFHAETANGQAFRLIDNIRSAGMKCGLVVNPETQLDIVTLYLDRVDKVTIMTVDPFCRTSIYIRNAEKDCCLCRISAAASTGIFN